MIVKYTKLTSYLQQEVTELKEELARHEKRKYFKIIKYSILFQTKLMAELVNFHRNSGIVYFYVEVHANTSESICRSLLRFLNYAFYDDI